MILRRHAHPRAPLHGEYEAIEADYEGADDLPDETDARLGDIKTAIKAFDSRPVRFSAEQTAGVGVFISLRSDGTLAVERGYVRPEDEEPVEPVAGESVPDAMAEATAAQPVITTPWQPLAPDAPCVRGTRFIA